MKKISILVSLVLSLSLFISCGTTSNKNLGGESMRKTEGWVDGDTYEMVVVGTWDRSRYYVEGNDPVEGKEAKPSLVLQQDAKTAAKVVAMRNFKEKMGAYIKSKTGVEDGKLIGDVIQSGLEGIVISPAAIEENYTPRFDARITYQFSADGLKKTVDSLANQVLKKKNKMSDSGGGM
ncbi:MAG TPA: hypothetical protein VKS21_13955 [Spirochaetota bacterium]|nr:hypothetical protein [Spirochaetota bacterium]